MARGHPVVELTTQTMPKPATPWRTRLMAEHVRQRHTVLRVWRGHGLKPHRVESFTLSSDPQFTEKLEDIVGLYLSPLEHALVLCCDEKTRAGWPWAIHALD